MKLNISSIAVISSLLFYFGFSQDSQNSQSLDDVVVKETYEAGFEEEKIPFFLETDFSNIIEIPERLHWSSVNREKNQSAMKGDLIDLNLSVPELVNIKPAPARTFHVNFKDLSSWKLDIMTSSGQRFRTISGEGDPPEEVNWDGRDDSGKPLTPGEQYAYSFTAIDKAGNRRTFPGDGFSVPALYLKNEQGIWIGISNSLLFSSEGYGLTPSAKNYSKELINFVYYYADQKQVRIRSQHPASDQFIDLLNQYLGDHYYLLERETGDNLLKNCLTLIIK